MGIAYVDGIVRGPEGKEDSVRLLVDSGATYTLLPEPIWEAIGLEGKRGMTFTLADGTTLQRQVSVCSLWPFPRAMATHRSSGGSRGTRPSWAW